jgi:hypothetical protein
MTDASARNSSSRRTVRSDRLVIAETKSGWDAMMTVNTRRKKRVTDYREGIRPHDEDADKENRDRR